MNRDRPGFAATAFAGIWATAAVTSSCASGLHRSRLDRRLSAIGTYECRPQARPSHPAVEPDETQARCYRDRWLVDVDDVRWIRAVFADSRCEGAPLGVGERRWALDAGTSMRRLRQAGATTLRRNDPGWFYDHRLGCDLRQRPLNHPFPATSFADCARLFEDGPAAPRAGDALEFAATTATTTADPEAPYQKLALINAGDGRRAPSCTR